MVLTHRLDRILTGPEERAQGGTEPLPLAGEDGIELTGPDQELPPSVRLRQGRGAAGKMLRYYLNYSGAPQSFEYPHAAGVDLLTGDAVAKGQQVTLEPWGLVIVEES